MDANRFDAWTRRRFGRAAGGMVALLLGLGALEGAVVAKGKGKGRGKGGKDKDKDRNKRKDKDKEQECSTNLECDSGCMECADGICVPKLPLLCAVCEDSLCNPTTQKLQCFPKCPNGQVCCGGGCAEPCTNGCMRNPTTCSCDTPAPGASWCARTNTCASHICADNQYFDQGTCECTCPSGKVLCGDKCVSDACESLYYFDDKTCSCECLNGGARCPTNDPRGACCYPGYVCSESTCYPPK